ncbi:unnamed protein product [Rotaria sp. Silwood1]|nr:unnamed protein product [Rotaria sp. Silwood1]
MLPTTSALSATMPDDCCICLNALAPGSPLLTLSCNHKFHLQCLALNLKAQHQQCPLCRVNIDTSVIQMLTSANTNTVPLQQQNLMHQYGADPLENNQHDRSILSSVDVVASMEDPLDNIAVQTFSTRISSARQANILSNVTTIPMITVSTTLEFDGQLSYQESNIYGLVTLKAPSISWPSEEDLSSISRVPIDLICVVDQSKSMTGNKMTLLKQTLIYIVEQLNEMDRLAIISFDRRAFDRSHGLKRMNQQNQERIKRAINDDMQVGSGTFIGCGLKMGIDLFTSRQTRNPLSALLLLTDGEDNRKHDYSQLMERLPEEIPCHTFGYGRKHETALLVQLAEQGNGGTFTYIVS